MKFSILAENLKKGVDLTTKIISSKVQLPILANILFDAGKEGLYLSSTNLETSIVIFLPAKIEEEGRFTLPAKTLAEIISSLPLQTVVVKKEKEKVIFACEGMNLALNGLSAAEFPKIEKQEKDSQVWEVEADQFCEAVGQVVFSASLDEARPVLTGVLLEAGKSAKMVATDGYRLSVRKINLPQDKETTCVVPARALQEISRVAGQGKKIKIALWKNSNQINFSFDNIQVTSRLLAGQYPPFGKVIPSQSKTKTEIDRQQLLQNLKLAAVFAKASANIVKMEFLPEKNKVEVSASAAGVGDNQTLLDAKVEGERVQIAFNYRFLLEFLASSDKERLQIKTTDPLSPAVFTWVGQEEFLHVIMPVRTQEA